MSKVLDTQKIAEDKKLVKELQAGCNSSFIQKPLFCLQNGTLGGYCQGSYRSRDSMGITAEVTAWVMGITEEVTQ